MDKKHNRKNQYYYNKRKKKKMTTVNHITGAPPNKSQRDYRRNLGKKIGNRQSLQAQELSHKLRVGAINIDGLDLENCVEVEKFLAERDFDVSVAIDLINIGFNFFFIHNL